MAVPDPLRVDPAPVDQDGVETTPLPVFLSMGVPLPRHVEGLSIMQPADWALPPQRADMPPGLRPHSHSKRRSGGDEPASTTQAQGAARGLLVTPWFAAAAGFVIAAGMWIISPHTDLIDANPAINSVTGGPQGGNTRHLTGSGDGTVQQPSKQTRSGHSLRGTGARGRHGKPVPVTVYYHGIVWHDGGFFLVISLPESLRGTHWKLEFRLPGDQDIKVVDASWRAAGPDGGTARELVPDPGHWENYRHLNGYPGWRPPPGVDFFAYGTGTDVKPTGCTLNGKDCRLVPLPTSHGSGTSNHGSGGTSHGSGSSGK